MPVVFIKDEFQVCKDVAQAMHGEWTRGGILQQAEANPENDRQFWLC